MLARKHGDCPGFAAFEATHGTAAARDILERFSEELWSRGSQEGVALLDVECLDTLGDNHRVEGLIEHEKAWYAFEAHSGSSYGTQLDSFELENAAPPQTFDEDCYDLVGQHTTLWRRSCPAISGGGLRSWSQLGQEREAKRQPLLSHQPKQVHLLVKPVLGDLALPHEDYHLHALKMARGFLRHGKADARALFAHLSADYKQALSQAQQAFEAKHPLVAPMSAASFFAWAMEPVIAAQLF